MLRGVRRYEIIEFQMMLGSIYAQTFHTGNYVPSGEEFTIDPTSPNWKDSARKWMSENGWIEVPEEKIIIIVDGGQFGWMSWIPLKGTQDEVLVTDCPNYKICVSTSRLVLAQKNRMDVMHALIPYFIHTPQENRK